MFAPTKPPVLDWRCQLTQVDLYNGRKTVGWLVGLLESSLAAVSVAVIMTA